MHQCVIHRLDPTVEGNFGQGFSSPLLGRAVPEAYRPLLEQMLDGQSITSMDRFRIAQRIPPLASM